MDQALNSQKTPHTSPLRASYGMSFVSILMKNDRVIKGFYCITLQWQIQDTDQTMKSQDMKCLLCIFSRKNHHILKRFNCRSQLLHHNPVRCTMHRLTSSGTRKCSQSCDTIPNDMIWLATDHNWQRDTKKLFFITISLFFQVSVWNIIRLVCVLLSWYS